MRSCTLSAMTGSAPMSVDNPLPHSPLASTSQDCAGTNRRVSDLINCGTSPTGFEPVSLA